MVRHAIMCEIFLKRLGRTDVANQLRSPRVSGKVTAKKKFGSDAMTKSAAREGNKLLGEQIHFNWSAIHWKAWISPASSSGKPV